MTQQTQTFPTKVTYLSHAGREHISEPKLPNLQKKISLRRAVKIPLPSYRKLYNDVGEPHYWVSRNELSNPQLQDIIHNDKVEIHLLREDRKLIGFFELDFRTPQQADIAFLGLIPQYVGRGLGPFLLQSAIQKAWMPSVQKLTIETCTLDHPAALPLYKKYGFRPYAFKHRIIRVPKRDPESDSKTASSAHAEAG